MDWITTTAGTVDEAKTRALDLLGVHDADAEIQVLEEGKKGLFGRTKTEARVRARIKPKAPPAKEERRGGGRNDGRRNNNRNRRNRNNRGDRNQNKSKGSSNSNQANIDGDGGKGSANQGRGNAGKSGGNSGKSGKSGNGGSKGANNKGGRSGGRNRGGDNRRNRGRNDGGEDRVEMPVAEQRETLEAFVTGVATAFDSSATVTLVEEGTTLQAEVTGESLGELVGAKAATLQTLEELARTAMHRAAAGRRYHRIQVDVDSYKARRREALARFATDLAQQVADSGVAKGLEPMNAADRKLVHDAVSDVAGVETISEGRDPRRYIVIQPLDVDEEE